MKLEFIKASRYFTRRNGMYFKTGKITILTTDPQNLTIDQHDKLLKFLETL